MQIRSVHNVYIHSMNVFITGGTGFVGRALVLRLRRDGHTVTVLTRNVNRASSLLGKEAEFLDSNSGDEAISEALARSTAVVNLAGEPLVGGRWTEEKKQRFRKSRVGFTNDLVGHLSAISERPTVLVSASAVGYYGNRGDAILEEDSSAGDDFLSQLCVDWEAAARKAESLGVRVVTPRLGVVLGPEEGALSKMIPAFRAGLGGPVGSGFQFVPWIHVDDLVELLITMIRDERYAGAVNATAPKPVRFKQFSAALGSGLSKPAFLPVPSLALRVLFGEAADVLLNSQRAIPTVASVNGFQFAHATIESAFADILDSSEIHITTVDGPIPQSDYLTKNHPSYLLKAESTLGQPLDTIFDFFSRPENLGLITPPGMQFRMMSSIGEIAEGVEIRYKLRVGPLPISWTTRIDVWEDRVRFVDSQIKGPYSSWWHEHRFEANGETTKMFDRVFYTPPAGPLGKIANCLFIEDELRRVFAYRTAVMRRRFG